MIVETAKGIEYIQKFWVDGREHRCKVPAREMAASSSDGATTVSSGALEKRIEAMETRIGQLIQASDDMRAWFYRIILTVAMVIAFMVVLWIGWGILSSWLYRDRPPLDAGTLRVPVQINGKTALLYVDVKGWEAPPEVAEEWFQRELARRAAELEKQKAATQPSTKPAK
jgi:hypothetical protein